MHNWLWINSDSAADIASSKDKITEKLRKGYGFLDLNGFVEKLETGVFKIIAFQNRTAALIEIVDTSEGRLLNILTCTGTLKQCAVAIQWLEEAAKELGVHSIISVGHIGWKEIVEANGYYTEPKLLMKKVLNDQRTESNASN